MSRQKGSGDTLKSAVAGYDNDVQIGSGSVSLDLGSASQKKRKSTKKKNITMKIGEVNASAVVDLHCQACNLTMLDAKALEWHNMSSQHQENQERLERILKKQLKMQAQAAEAQAAALTTPASVAYSNASSVAYAPASSGYSTSPAMGAYSTADSDIYSSGVGGYSTPPSGIYSTPGLGVYSVPAEAMSRPNMDHVPKSNIEVKPLLSLDVKPSAGIEVKPRSNIDPITMSHRLKEVDPPRSKTEPLTMRQRLQQVEAAGESLTIDTYAKKAEAVTEQPLTMAQRLKQLEAATAVDVPMPAAVTSSVDTPTPLPLDLDSIKECEKDRLAALGAAMLANMGGNVDLEAVLKEVVGSTQMTSVTTTASPAVGHPPLFPSSPQGGYPAPPLYAPSFFPPAMPRFAPTPPVSVNNMGLAPGAPPPPLRRAPPPLNGLPPGVSPSSTPTSVADAPILLRRAEEDDEDDENDIWGPDGRLLPQPPVPPMPPKSYGHQPSSNVVMSHGLPPPPGVGPPIHAVPVVRPPGIYPPEPPPRPHIGPPHGVYPPEPPPPGMAAEGPHDPRLRGAPHDPPMHPPHDEMPLHGLPPHEMSPHVPSPHDMPPHHVIHPHDPHFQNGPPSEAPPPHGYPPHGHHPEPPVPGIGPPVLYPQGPPQGPYPHGPLDAPQGPYPPGPQHGPPQPGGMPQLQPYPEFQQPYHCEQPPIQNGPFNALPLPLQVVPDGYVPSLGAQVEALAMGQGEPLDKPLRNIFIGGLARETNKDGIEAYCSTHGVIKDIWFAQQKDGTSKGFCFVEFETVRDAEWFVARPHVVDGKQVDVKYDKKRQEALDHIKSVGVDEMVAARLDPLQECTICMASARVSEWTAHLFDQQHLAVLCDWVSLLGPHNIKRSYTRDAAICLEERSDYVRTNSERKKKGVRAPNMPDAVWAAYAIFILRTGFKSERVCLVCDTICDNQRYKDLETWIRHVLSEPHAINCVAKLKEMGDEAYIKRFKWTPGPNPMFVSVPDRKLIPKEITPGNQTVAQIVDMSEEECQERLGDIRAAKVAIIDRLMLSKYGEWSTTRPKAEDMFGTPPVLKSGHCLCSICLTYVEKQRWAAHVEEERHLALTAEFIALLGWPTVQARFKHHLPDNAEQRGALHYRVQAVDLHDLPEPFLPEHRRHMEYLLLLLQAGVLYDFTCAPCGEVLQGGGNTALAWVKHALSAKHAQVCLQKLDQLGDFPPPYVAHLPDAEWKKLPEKIRVMCTVRRCELLPMPMPCEICGEKLVPNIRQHAASLRHLRMLADCVVVMGEPLTRGGCLGKLIWPLDPDANEMLAAVIEGKRSRFQAPQALTEAIMEDYARFLHKAAISSQFFCSVCNEDLRNENHDMETFTYHMLSPEHATACANLLSELGEKEYHIQFKNMPGPNIENLEPSKRCWFPASLMPGRQTFVADTPAVSEIEKKTQELEKKIQLQKEKAEKMDHDSIVEKAKPFIDKFIKGLMELKRPAPIPREPTPPPPPPPLPPLPPNMAAMVMPAMVPKVAMPSPEKPLDPVQAAVFAQAQSMMGMNANNPYQDGQQNMQHDNKWKTGICRAWEQGKCQHPASLCKFAHGEEDKRHPDGVKKETGENHPYRKTRICKNWEMGICIYGDEKCHYAHGPEDIRAPNTAPPPPKTGPSTDPSRDIHVSNVPMMFTDTKLHMHFTEFGTVEQVDMKRVVNKPLKYAYVRFERAQSLHNVMNKGKMHIIDGYTIYCSYVNKHGEETPIPEEPEPQPEPIPTVKPTPKPAAKPSAKPAAKPSAKPAAKPPAPARVEVEEENPVPVAKPMKKKEDMTLDELIALRMEEQKKEKELREKEMLEKMTEKEKKDKAEQEKKEKEEAEAKKEAAKKVKEAQLKVKLGEQRNFDAEKENEEAKKDELDKWMAKKRRMSSPSPTRATKHASPVRKKSPISMKFRRDSKGRLIAEKKERGEVDDGRAPASHPQTRSPASRARSPIARTQSVSSRPRSMRSRTRTPSSPRTPSPRRRSRSPSTRRDHSRSPLRKFARRDFSRGRSPGRPASRSPLRKPPPKIPPHQYTKTRICKNWEEDNCVYGREKCYYAHGPDDLRRLSPPPAPRPRSPVKSPIRGLKPPHQFAKTRICKNWENTQCVYGKDKCHYAHGPEDLRRLTPPPVPHPRSPTRPPPPPHQFAKTRICKNWEAGLCVYGIDKCHYAHGPDDLRPSVDVHAPPGEVRGPPEDLRGPPKEPRGPPVELRGPPVEPRRPPGEYRGPPGEFRGPPGEYRGPPEEIRGPYPPEDYPPRWQPGDRPPSPHYPRDPYARDPYGYGPPPPRSASPYARRDPYDYPPYEKYPRGPDPYAPRDPYAPPDPYTPVDPYSRDSYERPAPPSPQPKALPKDPYDDMYKVPSKDPYDDMYASKDPYDDVYGDPGPSPVRYKAPTYSAEKVQVRDYSHGGAGDVKKPVVSTVHGYSPAAAVVAKVSVTQDRNRAAASVAKGSASVAKPEKKRASVAKATSEARVQAKAKKSAGLKRLVEYDDDDHSAHIKMEAAPASPIQSPAPAADPEDMVNFLQTLDHADLELMADTAFQEFLMAVKATVKQLKSPDGDQIAAKFEWQILQKNRFMQNPAVTALLRRMNVLPKGL